MTSWSSWRTSKGSRRSPYDPIGERHRSSWTGSPIGTGSYRRPLWSMLMSSLRSKPTTSGIANRFPRRLRLCGRFFVTRSARLVQARNRRGNPGPQNLSVCWPSRRLHMAPCRARSSKLKRLKLCCDPREQSCCSLPFMDCEAAKYACSCSTTSTGVQKLS